MTGMSWWMTACSPPCTVTPKDATVSVSPGATAVNWPACAANVPPSAAGDELSIGSFAVTVHGTEHAVIHPDIPVIPNVGYLINGSLYHPGDAYYVPEVPVSVLLLPTSGPWMKIREAADYVRAVRPQQIVQIHEMLLSDIGLHLASNLLGEQGLTGLPLTVVPAGESLTV